MVDRRSFLKYSVLAVPGLSGVGQAFAQAGPLADYPIATLAYTTLASTVVPTAKPATTIRLDEVAKYAQYGYGEWTPGAGLEAELRSDLMAPGYDAAALRRKTRLLRFFTISDIHITDKESPSQLIYLQQLTYPSKAKAPWAFVTSIYSPVMLYSTHVLDAAVQTVNALHRQNPIDFGLSLGDTCNSTQYNELRWYIDVLDGQAITPSSGAHLGADSIDFQKPYQATGLDKSIPWYQTMGNHDHFFIGSIPIDDALRTSYVSDTVLAAGDVLIDPRNIAKPDYYMGVLDGVTPDGQIRGAGPVGTFATPPKVAADPDRRSLSRGEWMQEFFASRSQPRGHGFSEADVKRGFTCYSFVPKASVPIRVIVLDDTRRDDDGSPDIHGHGCLDQERYDWLRNELAAGSAADQLMIIGAHIPIGVEKPGSGLGWWNDPRNAVSEAELIRELQSHPNFMLWLAGHRHRNAVRAFPGALPENGFWQVETSSLRDFPQQLRTFEIEFNNDLTISIVATNVDPAVRPGTPAARSRAYAVAAQQIINTNVYANDPIDPSIRAMPIGSYNAVLLKQLSPTMQAKLDALCVPSKGESK